MNICIVGNSHLAALKQAVDNGALDASDANIVFFGAAGKKFKDIDVQDGIIRGPDSLSETFLMVSEGRYTKIDPSEFDVVIVYGLPCHTLLGSLRTTHINKVHLTEDCLSAGVEKWVRTKPKFRLAKKIGKACPTTRVILVPRPIPAAGEVKEAEAPCSESKQWLWKSMESSFREDVWSAIVGAAGRNGVEVAFLQPDSTLDENQFTRPEYSTHAARLREDEKQHDDADVNHMNAKFGEVFLQSLYKYLAKTPSPG